MFTDVTTTAGVGSSVFNVGAAFGDLDNDGDLDLYVVTIATGDDVLYRNDGPVGPGGEYVFTDVTASAGITEVGLGMGVHSFDYDNDLDMDLYWTSWRALP